MAKFKRGNLDLKTNQKIRLGDNLESQIDFDGSTLNLGVTGDIILSGSNDFQLNAVNQFNVIVDSGEVGNFNFDFVTIGLTGGNGAHMYVNTDTNRWSMTAHSWNYTYQDTSSFYVVSNNVEVINLTDTIQKIGTSTNYLKTSVNRIEGWVGGGRLLDIDVNTQRMGNTLSGNINVNDSDVALLSGDPTNYLRMTGGEGTEELEVALANTSYLNLTLGAQRMGVTSDSNIIVNQTSDFIGMTVFSDDKGSLVQAVDVDGANSNVYIGDQTGIHMAVGIGSSPIVRMISGSDTWFQAEPAATRIGANGAGDTNLKVETYLFELEFQGEEAIRLFDSQGSIVYDQADDFILFLGDKDGNGKVRGITAAVDGNRFLNVDSTGVTLLTGTNIDEFSTDGTLSDNSNTAVPTEQAVKTYVNTTVNAASSETSGMQVSQVWNRSVEALKGTLSLNPLDEYTINVTETDFPSTPNLPDMGVTALENGKMFVAWSVADGIDFDYLDSDGNFDSTSPNNISLGGSGSYMDACTLESGHILLAYRDVNDSSKGKFVIYDGQANVVVATTEFADASTGEFTVAWEVVALALKDGGFVIKYVDDDSNLTKVIIYNADASVRVSQFTIFPGDDSFWVYGQVLQNGNIIFAGAPDDKNKFTIIDPNGNTVVPVTQITSSGAGHTDQAVLPNGNIGLFVATNGGDLTATLLDQDGNIVVPETSIIAGSEDPDGVVALPSNRFFLRYSTFYAIIDENLNVISSGNTIFTTSSAREKTTKVFRDGRIFTNSGPNGKFAIVGGSGVLVASDLVVTGTVEVGINDTAKGLLNIYGADEEFGGELRFYNASDSDGLNEYWKIDLVEDEWSFTSSSGQQVLRFYGGDDSIEFGNSAGNLYLYGTTIDFYTTTSLRNSASKNLITWTNNAELALYNNNVKVFETTSDGIKLNLGASTINEFSIDGTLVDNSDTAVPTEKAVKTYVDNQTILAVANSGILSPQEIYNSSVVALKGSTKIDVLDWEVKVGETTAYIGTQNTRGAATSLMNGKVMVASGDSAAGVGKYAIIDNLGNIDTTSTTFTSSFAASTRLATLVDGRVVFAYVLGTVGYFQVRDQEGNVSIAETDFTPSGFGDLYSTIGVTKLLDGGFAIAFTDDGDDPWIKFFNSDGSTRLEGFEISSSGLATGGTGRLETLPNGNIVVVIESNAGSFWIYDPQGNSVYSDTSIDLDWPSAAVLANGNIFIADYDPSFRIYDFNGNLVKSETPISGASSANEAAVLALPNGDALIYYVTTTGIEYAIYSAEGELVKAATSIGSITGGISSANLGAVFTNGNVFLSYYDSANTELVFQILQGTGTSIASDLVVDGSGDFQSMAIGSAASPLSIASLYINENFTAAGPTFGVFISSENTSNFDLPFTATAGLGVSVQQNVSTLQNLVEGANISVNIGADGAVVTKATAVKATSFVTADNTTIGTMIGGDFKVSPATSMSNAAVTDMIGGQFQILGAGSGDISVTNGYGVLIETPSFNPSGTTDNLYGLYIEDQSTVGFTTDYNLYSAGLNSRNKIEGILEVDNIDSTALVVTGDIHCDDLFTSGATIHVGTGQIKSTTGNIELYYAGTKVVETTPYGLNNPKTDITISGKTGWAYDAKDTLSFTFDSTAMIFTLSDSGGSHEFWVQGVKYTKTGDQSVAITDTEGLWYINYNNSGVLTASQTLWVLSAEDSALVATLYWDTDNQEAIFIGLELHSYSMPSITHYHLHETVGTLYESGLGVTDNANGTLDIVAGELHDEDIVINITDNIGSGFWDQILSPAELPIYYKDGASGNWRKVYNTTSLTYFAYQDVSDNPYWNQFTGGAWQLTPSSNNSNTAWWILATNNIDEPVIIVMGQGTPNIIESVAITSNDINNLDLGDFGSQEFKILYRVMVKNTGVPYVTGTITDFRTAQVVGGTGGSVNDHGALNGLGDNDHVQYLLRSETEAGTDSISNDTTSVTVTFTTAQPDTNYSISCSFINTIDPDPLDLIYKITSKLTTGFTATFNQTTDSANYSLDWIIKHH